MCSYMRMFTVRHILIAWRMLRKGCYGNSNVLAFSIVRQTKTIQWFQCHAWMRFFLFLKMEEKKSPFSKISGYLCTCGQLRYCSRKGYIATTGTRFTWKKIIQSQRFLKTTDSPAFFCKRTNNIQENEGCFLRGQVCMVEPWILLLRLQKNLENLWFPKNIVTG